MAATRIKRRKFRPYYSDHYKALRRFILPISFILGILGYGLYFFLGTMSFIFLLPLALAFIIYLNLETIHQVSLIAGNHYQFGIQQVQSIQAIYHTLQPELPLPSMARWAGNPDFCQLIVQQVLTAKPRIILELGSGVSTLVAGLAQRRTGGTLISIDHDDQFLAETVAGVRHHNLSDNVQVYHCPLTDLSVDSATYQWYDLSFMDEITSIDLLIIDGPPGRIQEHSRFPALPVLYDKLSENAVILLDDARRADEQEIVMMWKNMYAELNTKFVGTEKGAYLLYR